MQLQFIFRYALALILLFYPIGGARGASLLLFPWLASTDNAIRVADRQIDMAQDLKNTEAANSHHLRPFDR